MPNARGATPAPILICRTPRQRKREGHHLDGIGLDCLLCAHPCIHIVHTWSAPVDTMRTQNTMFIAFAVATICGVSSSPVPVDRIVPEPRAPPTVFTADAPNIVNKELAAAVADLNQRFAAAVTKIDDKIDKQRMVDYQIHAHFSEFKTRYSARMDVLSNSMQKISQTTEELRDSMHKQAALSDARFSKIATDIAAVKADAAAQTRRRRRSTR